MTETEPLRFLPAAERRARTEFIAARNARLNKAARLARTAIGGKVGEELADLMVAFYGTDSAGHVDQLAKAVIAEHGHL
jgi:hypothetical protein